jgi:hypothetical protein
MRKCFVISPIDSPDTATREHADAVWEYIIDPALTELKIKPIRADMMSGPGHITEQMIAAIEEYDFCIADLSGHNPNVFYELALAQAAERPVIMMKLSGQPIPFDVKNYRLLEFDLKPRNIRTKVWIPVLQEHVRIVLQPSYKPPRLLRERRLNHEDTGQDTRSFSKELCTAIGLLDAEPIETEVFQSFRFHPENNRNPVANLWADPQPSNYVHANLHQREGVPVLRVSFGSTANSYSPAVAIHPDGLGLRRRPGTCNTLAFKAVAVSPSEPSDVPPIVVGVRVVDGHARHWKYIVASGRREGFQQIPLTAEIGPCEVPLTDPSRWRPFTGAGPQDHPRQADFKVIASFVLHLGLLSGGDEPGPGEGVLEVADIRFR